jgi:autotransporter translocation and assembly factor TamB
MGFPIFNGANIMIRKISYAILSVLILLIAAAIYLVSPLGIQASLKIIGGIAPGTLTYKSVKGSILGPMTFTGFNYSTKAMDIHAEKLNLDWHPLALLHKQINFIYINGSEINTNFNYKIASKPDNNNTSLKNYSIAIHKSLLSNINIAVNHSNLLSIAQIHTHGVITHDKIDIYLITKLINRSSITAKTHAIGKIQQYEFSTNITGDNSNFKLIGEGNPDSATFKTIKSKLFGGSLSGNGNVNWSKKKWAGNLTAKNLNLNLINKYLPPTISFKIITDGEVYNKKPLTYMANAHIYNKSNDITVKINQKKSLIASWNAKMLDMKNLSAALSGSIITQGHLIKDTAIYSEGNFSSNKLTYKNISTNNAKANWFIKNNTGDISLKIKNLLYNQLQLNNIVTELHGSKQKHSIHINLNSLDNNLTLDAKGTSHNNKWQETIGKLILKNRLLHLQNKKDITITLNNNHLNLPTSCLYGKSNNQVCAKLEVNASNSWDSDISAKNIPSNITKLVLANNMKLFGKLNSHITMSGKKFKIHKAQAELSTTNGKLTYTDSMDKHQLNFKQAIISATLNNQSLETSGTLKINPEGTLKAHIDMNNFNWQKPSSHIKKISGSILASIKNINSIKGLFPATSTVSGTLNGNININGNSSHPIINGAVDLTNGELNMPLIGVKINDIHSKISTKQNVIHTETQISIHKKPLNIISNTYLDDHSPTTITQIYGNAILFASTPTYRLDGSPNLILTYLNKQAELTGQINLSDSKLDLTTFDTITTIPSNDITYTTKNSHNTARKKPAFKTKISINLLKNNTLYGYGLNAVATGHLQLTHSYLTPYQADNGEIRFPKGTFAAYGHTLDLNNNSFINYNHQSISNPNLFVKASKKIDTSATPDNPVNFKKYEVGVNISGTLNNTEIQLFSTPSDLTKTQILSLLMFGYSYNNDSNNPSILQALGALQIAQSGLSTSGGITSAIRSSLGLSELGINQYSEIDAIGNTIDNNTSFIIGKYINRRTYIRYLRDLSDINPSQIIQLKFILNNRLSIQLSDNIKQLYSSQGIDILYSGSK